VSAQAIQAASIYILASLKDEVTGELKRVKGEVNDLSGGFRKGISALGDFGSSLSSLVAPLGLIGGIGISTAAGFDQAMATVGARAGLVGADLDRVRKFALDMGAQFPVSSTEAADALGELMAAGMNTESAMAALPAVLTGAAASGESLASVTSVLTVILSSFGLEASESANVVDILSQAAAVSTGSIASLGEGFANVGAIAAQFGLDVKDTAAALAILDNAGIKGAEGGTALKSLFTQLNSKVGQKQLKDLGTSLYYTNDQIRDIIKTNKMLAKDGIPPLPVPKAGDIRPFADVLDEIEIKLDGMTDQQRNAALDKLGGSFGKVALSALLSGASLEEVERLMNQQASATEVADARMKSFNGVMTNLQGSVEALMINAFTPFMENVLTPLGVKVNDVVNQLNEWVQVNPELTTQIIGVGAALLLLGGGSVGVAFVVGKVIELAGAFKTLMTFALPVIAPLAVIFGLVYAYLNNLGGFADWVNGVGDGFRELDPAAQAAVLSVGALGIAFVLFNKSLIAGQLAIWIGQIATALSASFAAGGIVGVATTIVSGLAGAFSLLSAALMPIAGAVWALLAPFLAIAAPIALVAGLLAAYLTNFGGFKDFIDGIGTWMKTEIPKAWNAAGKVISGMLNNILGALVAFKDMIIRVLLTPLKMLFDAVRQTAQAIGNLTLAAQMQSALNEIDRVNGVGAAYNPENNKFAEVVKEPGKAIGGKLHGITRVGEHNNPELYREGSKTYLIPGERTGEHQIFPRSQEGASRTKHMEEVTLRDVQTPEQLFAAIERLAEKAAAT
jgi:TP901 family phage tail tape measure protein